MKRDGRKLDHATLETIRLMAVERVREGEAPSSVIASYGFSRTAIYKWLTAASKPGVGLRALQARPAPGRPRSLTPRQEQQVFRCWCGRPPEASMCQNEVVVLISDKGSRPWTRLSELGWIRRSTFSSFTE